MGMGAETLGAMNAGIKLSRSFVIIASPMYFKKLFTESELSTILYLALHDQNRKVIVVPQWEDHDAEYISSKLGYPYRVSTRIVTIDGDDDDRFHRTRSIGWP